MNKITFFALVSGLFLSACSGFFLGKENLSEAVDLPKNAQKVSFKKLWSTSVGDGTDGKELKLAPKVVAGMLYMVSADRQLVAFDFESGKRIWKAKTGHNIAAGVSVDAGIVVVGTENGLLLAYHADDGELLWRHQLSTEIIARPVMQGGILVARAVDGQVTGLDASNGSALWRSNVGVSDLSIRGNSEPILLDGIVLFTNAKGRLSVLNAVDGQEVFSAPVVRGQGQTKVERIVDLVATPAIDNGILYISAYRHRTLAINLTNGSLLWDSEQYSSQDLFVDNNHVYTIDKNSIIRALTKDTGKLAWESEALEGRRLSPITGDGQVITTIDYDGMLSVLDASSGEVLGYHRVGGERAYVAPLYLNNRWVSYTSDGDLTVFEIEY